MNHHQPKHPGNPDHNRWLWRLPSPLTAWAKTPVSWWNHAVPNKDLLSAASTTITSLPFSVKAFYQPLALFKSLLRCIKNSTHALCAGGGRMLHLHTFANHHHQHDHHKHADRCLPGGTLWA